jgi:hypothetical protein
MASGSHEGRLNQFEIEAFSDSMELSVLENPPGLEQSKHGNGM